MPFFPNHRKKKSKTQSPCSWRRTCSRRSWSLCLCRSPPLSPCLPTGERRKVMLPINCTPPPVVVPNTRRPLLEWDEVHKGWKHNKGWAEALLPRCCSDRPIDQKTDRQTYCRFRAVRLSGPSVVRWKLIKTRSIRRRHLLANSLQHPYYKGLMSH